MSGSASDSSMMAPRSLSSPGPNTQARRRSSLVSGFASLSLSSTHSQSRNSSKWSIASCFSEGSSPDKGVPSSQHDYSSPVSPLAANLDRSTVASRHRSYIPKRAAGSFPTCSPPMYAREAGAASAKSAVPKRMTYATQYGYRAPASTNLVETVAASKP